MRSPFSVFWGGRFLNAVERKIPDGIKDRIKIKNIEAWLYFFLL
jgi:hypothetical protein